MISIVVVLRRLEQMLINLVRNAADAVLEMPSLLKRKAEPTDPSPSDSEIVRVHWDANEKEVTVAVEDEGPGLLNPANVFTPLI